jgi:hypothetical protein
MQKRIGDPDILEKGSITFDFPHEFVVNSHYHFRIILNNKGQGLWSENANYRLALEHFNSTFFSQI